ncbi:MAG: zinc ribbon domain-containing protein [Nostoc sp.]|uniref:FmdB family zinc ribbon protein n=1 Tax=Nostoc sp. TaxID=1180 RepID=UPI002FEE89B0
MKVFLEYLYHYRCDFCQKWWTVGDIQPNIEQELFCPHCGKSNTVEVIEHQMVILNYEAFQAIIKREFNSQIQEQIIFNQVEESFTAQILFCNVLYSNERFGVTVNQDINTLAINADFKKALNKSAHIRDDNNLKQLMIKNHL